MTKYKVNNISQIKTMYWCVSEGNKVPYMTSRIQRKLYSYIKKYTHYEKHNKIYCKGLELSSREYRIIIDKMKECELYYHNNYLHLKRTLNYIIQD